MPTVPRDPYAGGPDDPRPRASWDGPADGSGDVPPNGSPRRVGTARVVGAVGLAAVALLGLTSGLSGLLVVGSLYLAVTALWALWRGRSWLGITGRPAAAALLAVSMVLLGVGAATADPVGTTPDDPGPVVAPTASGAPRPDPEPSATAAEPSVEPDPTSDPADDEPDDDEPDDPDDPAAGTALAALALLEVKGRAPMTGYDRDAYGQAWSDVDRNGCDTRNDILARDLVDETFRARTRDCVVLTGTLHDPYSGQTIAFRRGQDTSSEVQIDHVVALADSWQKGAQSWDEVRRTTFANDPLNLLAVDGPLNQAKRAGDAATWLPPHRSFRCAYVARQVAVKVEYGLWVTAAERDAVARVLATCPDEPLPDDDTLVVVPFTGDGDDDAGTGGGSGSSGGADDGTDEAPADAADVYYENCSAVRAAGADPVRAGEPGYARHLDRDGDGVGCE